MMLNNVDGESAFQSITKLKRHISKQDKTYVDDDSGDEGLASSKDQLVVKSTRFEAEDLGMNRSL